MPKMCEKCKDKRAHFGTPTERKNRWCGPCGKAHGAVNIHAEQMCEGCKEKHASFGTPTERKRRWCATCGKAHGAIALAGRDLRRAVLFVPSLSAALCGGSEVAFEAI